MASESDGRSDGARPYHHDFRLILENIREYAIFLMDPEGTITTWNRGVEEVFGYSRDEFVGSASEMIFTPEDREAAAPQWEMDTARREGKAADNRWHLRRDGTRLWANGTIMSLSDERSQLIGFIKIVRDNTEQEEAEIALRKAHAELESRVEGRTAELQLALEELRRSERLFSSIFRVGPFAAAVIDRDGTIRDVNEACCRLTGYEVDAAVGQSIGKLVPEGLPPFESPRARGSGYPKDGNEPELADLVATPAEPLDPAEAAGDVDDRAGDATEAFRDRELRLRTKDGDERTVLASGVGLPFDGDRRRLVMFFDITERKRSEEELMAAIQDVMQDASWFSRSVVERLAEIRAGSIDTSRVRELTRRERQVLEHVAMGQNNAQIAAELGIASQTVRNYITAVYEKIGVRSRVEAVVWARERGLGL